VQFDDFDNDYPIIATTTTGAFVLQGLGPAYGGDQGKVAFYLQTAQNVGSNGRGTGQVRSPNALTTGDWHYVVVEKEEQELSITVDGAKNIVTLPDTITAGQFELKPTGQILVDQGTDDEALSGKVKWFTIDLYEAGDIVTSQG